MSTQQQQHDGIDVGYRYRRCVDDGSRMSCDSRWLKAKKKKGTRSISMANPEQPGGESLGV